jgi:hypothetical protein
MGSVTLEYLTERLELADQLLAGRTTMLTPQDLPGRYGRVVKAVDHLLQVLGMEAVLGGGWAVWRHGYVGRVTQDLDVVLPADRIDEFLRVAAVSGFEVLPQLPGRWPKVRHKETDVRVDILPEGARPGRPSQLAPTTIRHPAAMGGTDNRLQYIDLAALVELKLGAGRLIDDSDLLELIRTNAGNVEAIRQHLATIHYDYVVKFDHLVELAQQPDER